MSWFILKLCLLDCLFDYLLSNWISQFTTPRAVQFSRPLPFPSYPSLSISMPFWLVTFALCSHQKKKKKTEKNIKKRVRSSPENISLENCTQLLSEVFAVIFFFLFLLCSVAFPQLLLLCVLWQLFTLTKSLCALFLLLLLLLLWVPSSLLPVQVAQLFGFCHYLWHGPGLLPLLPFHCRRLLCLPSSPLFPPLRAALWSHSCISINRNDGSHSSSSSRGSSSCNNGEAATHATNLTNPAHFQGWQVGSSLN